MLLFSVEISTQYFFNNYNACYTERGMALKIKVGNVSLIQYGISDKVDKGQWN